MVYRIVFPVSSSDLLGQSPIANVFKCELGSCLAFNKISSDIVSRSPSAVQ